MGLKIVTNVVLWTWTWMVDSKAIEWNVECIISCWATAHTDCSSCFSLTFAVVFDQTCLWDYKKAPASSLYDATHGKSAILSV